ncbi:hypothetical protein T10_3730 [Trichinella papuae]|uniref:Reverse transcriptase/retrotransposon-derived protein RNase H-like domain-containing protein n=1 Tax=Trichinella papuae TaxID=268474 RepID=A0A0V1N9F9_9BILA|nr:hypothetical protein T10_3730 [Trichinella papuae]
MSDTLVHYDKKLPLSMNACDHGLRAMLCHRFPSGVDEPIAFAFRLLTKTEKRYAAIDKEALGIFFGVKVCNVPSFMTDSMTWNTNNIPMESVFRNY